MSLEVIGEAQIVYGDYHRYYIHRDGKRYGTATFNKATKKVEISFDAKLMKNPNEWAAYHLFKRLLDPCSIAKEENGISLFDGCGKAVTKRIKR